MSGYTPHTEDVAMAYIHATNGDTWVAGRADALRAEFDRWLASVQAEARQAEREHIVDGLQLVASYVLKPSDYRDGYAQALSDIENDSLPNAPRFIITDEETE